MGSGALGLSTSWGEAHTDGDNRPVPSRAARRNEMLALAEAVGRHRGTSIELIPAMGHIPDERVALMTEMSLLADRPVNWNLLGHLSPVEIYGEQLESCDYAAARGATVVALTLPDVMRMRAHRVLEDMPVWRDVVDLPAGERRRLSQDPAMRERLHDGFDESTRRGLTAALNFERLQIADAPAGSEHLVGRSISSIARERNADPVDILIDVVLPDRLPLDTVFPSLVPEMGVTEASWKRRAEVWRDGRTVLGGSDAGAHIDLMCHANYTTVLLGESVRERAVLSIEEAVHQLTDVPARLYGLRHRGRVADGWNADLVVFDPDRVGSGPARPRRDLPGGGERMYAEGTGIAHVYVNGEEIVRDDAFTGAEGGQLLRSGIDTETVSASPSATTTAGAKITS
jgi:N-acyl-D-aspartate/D-glutamate deacylase